MERKNKDSEVDTIPVPGENTDACKTPGMSIKDISNFVNDNRSLRKDSKAKRTVMKLLNLGQFVGNKAKGRISKRVFQESKARQNFRKTNILFYEKQTNMFVFRKFWRAFLS